MYTSATPGSVALLATRARVTSALAALAQRNRFSCTGPGASDGHRAKHLASSSVAVSLSWPAAVMGVPGDVNDVPPVRVQAESGLEGRLVGRYSLGGAQIWATTLP